MVGAGRRRPRVHGNADSASRCRPWQLGLAGFGGFERARVHHGSKLPQTEAFAVKGDRVAALGTTKEIKGLVGRSTRIIDAQQMSVVPGFIDSHNHASGNTLLYEVLVGNPYDVEFTDIATIIDKLRAKAQKSPADTWVEGYFFDDTKLKDKRALTRPDLDRVSPQR